MEMEPFATSDKADICSAEENIKEIIVKLEFCNVADVGSEIQDVVKQILNEMRQIYDNSNAITKNYNDTEAAFEEIKPNLQAASNLVAILKEMVDCLTEKDVKLCDVVAVPFNIAHVLFLTFDYCKQCVNSKLDTEIMSLFRKGQALHTKFLTFLKSNLTVDFMNVEDVDAFKEDMMLTISVSLTGVNSKSMVDNWKSFAFLSMRNSFEKFYNFSRAILILTEEIDCNLELIMENGVGNDTAKVTGFLMKILLKLHEKLDIEENYNAVLKFWVMIYSWHFTISKKGKEDYKIISSLLQLCLDSKSILLSGDFVKTFCSTSYNYANSKHILGFFMVTNQILQQIQMLLKEKSEVCKVVQVAALFKSLIRLPKICHIVFFLDAHWTVYEDLIVNFAVLILHFPKQFFQVEKLFMSVVVEEHIWLAMMAIDIWVLVLRHSTPDTTRKVFTLLLKKGVGLNFNPFNEIPEQVRFCILIRRFFSTLPQNCQLQEVAKYNPLKDVPIWKIISLENVPVSYRYYIEFLVTDLAEKKLENLFNMTDMMEKLDLLSYCDFNSVELDECKMLQIMSSLWSFDLNQNIRTPLLKYFLEKLMKATKTLIRFFNKNLTSLILSKFKHCNEVFYLILICEILAAKNYENSSDKTLLSDWQRILLKNSQALVLQKALDTFHEISNSNVGFDIGNYKNQHVDDYLQKVAVEKLRNSQYLERLANHQNWIDDWEDNEPALKKFKKT